MVKRRRFTIEFRAEIVPEALSDENLQVELCRRHNLSEEQVSTWKRQLLENAASLFDTKDKVPQDAAERIAHLEQLVGKLTVELDIHEKAAAWLSGKRDPNAQDGKAE